MTFARWVVVCLVASGVPGVAMPVLAAPITLPGPAFSAGAQVSIYGPMFCTAGGPVFHGLPANASIGCANEFPRVAGGLSRIEGFGGATATYGSIGMMAEMEWTNTGEFVDPVGPPFPSIFAAASGSWEHSTYLRWSSPVPGVHTLVVGLGLQGVFQSQETVLGVAGFFPSVSAQASASIARFAVLPYTPTSVFPSLNECGPVESPTHFEVSKTRGSRE